jgi:hypothetical protein
VRQIQLIFNLTALFLLSCQTDNKEAVKEVDNLRPFPVVLDTLGIDTFLYSIDDENPTWLSTSNYNFYSIGEVEDTVYLGPFITFSAPPPPPLLPSGSQSTNTTEITEHENPFKKYYIEWDEERNYRYWTQSKIDVQVDTAIKISNSFPILLTNRDTDTIFIGYGRHVPLIMEATDSLGNWKPIQERFIHPCGIGVGSIILPPNECVLTLAPIFKGNYKTRLRLTLGDNHSNPFIGFINYRQFQSKFDEHGEYKAEYKREMDNYETTNH